MFIGRMPEIKQLAIFFARNIAGLGVCSGRRRIGKSTLIEYCAKDYRFLEFYGLAPRENATLHDQLNRLVHRAHYPGKRSSGKVVSSVICRSILAINLCQYGILACLPISWPVTDT